MLYDAFNRLVGETVTNTPPAGQGQPSVTQTAYVYDGSQVLLQFERPTPTPRSAMASGWAT